VRTFLTKTLESVDKQDASLTLSPDVDVRELDLKDIETIDIAFEKYTDGRGYTYARVLRTELLYKGEIRAIGEPIQAMLESTEFIKAFIKTLP